MARDLRRMSSNNVRAASQSAFRHTRNSISDPCRPDLKGNRSLIRHGALPVPNIGAGGGGATAGLFIQVAMKSSHHSACMIRFVPLGIGSVEGRPFLLLVLFRLESAVWNRQCGRQRDPQCLQGIGSVDGKPFRLLLFSKDNASLH